MAGCPSSLVRSVLRGSEVDQMHLGLGLYKCRLVASVGVYFWWNEWSLLSLSDEVVSLHFPIFFYSVSLQSTPSGWSFVLPILFLLQCDCPLPFYVS